MAIFWAFLCTIHYFNSVLFLYNYPNDVFMPSNEDIWIIPFSVFLIACFCAHLEPNLLSQTSISPQILVYFETKTSCKTECPSQNPTAYLLQSYVKCPMADDSDLKTAPSCQGGIAVIVSSVPFNRTLLVLICSLIFRSTKIRTQSCGYSSVVWRLCSSAHQSSGHADGSRFPSEPGEGSQLEPTHWSDLSLVSPYQNESQSWVVSRF